MSSKYVYSLFYKELTEMKSLKTLNSFLIMCGLNASEFNPRKTFNRYNVFNLNWLIVLTSWIQYRLYASSWFKKTKEEQIEENLVFFQTYPRMSQLFVIAAKCVEMSIPWICYIVFILIAVLNEKSLMNLALFLISLLLLFWHVTSDMINSKAHQRLINFWNFYTTVCTVNLICILVFQLSTMLSLLDYFENWRTYITDNQPWLDLIGLINYNP